MNDHQSLIRRAIALAEQAASRGNHPFGALLALDSAILLEAENTVITDADCTRHAELNLVSMASRQLPADAIASSTLYSSTEPCPMCAGALYWAGVRRVVYGCPTELLGKIAGGSFVMPCREVLVRASAPVGVFGPVLAEEAARAHQSFWPARRLSKTEGKGEDLPVPLVRDGFESQFAGQS